MRQAYHAPQKNINTSSQLDLFAELLPAKPYCTDTLEAGLIIRAKATALQKRHIQPNGPTHKHWLVVDIDREGGSIDWYERNAPAPNLSAKNPANGHAHLFYALETPVRTTYDANIDPLRYLAAVERGLVARLDADHAYSGLISKNPLHTHWQVAEWRSESYTLGELADWVDTSVPASNDQAFGYSRNVMLFDGLRYWAYKAIRQGWPDFQQWSRAVEDRATGLNQFPVKLPLKEVMGIAKSVAKWTYRNFTQRSFDLYVAETHTPEVQAARGRLKGKAKREQGLLLLSEGRSVREVMEITGATMKTVYNWKNSKKL